MRDYFSRNIFVDVGDDVVVVVVDVVFVDVDVFIVAIG